MTRYGILLGEKPKPVKSIPPAYMSRQNSPPPWEMEGVKECITAAEFIEFLKQDGGPWLVADSPLWLWIGFFRNSEFQESIMTVGIKLSNLKDSIHTVNGTIASELQKYAGRRRLAVALSRNKTCLRQSKNSVPFNV